MENNNIEVDKIKIIRKNRYKFFYNNKYLNEILVEIFKFDNEILFFWQCNEIPKKFFKKLKKFKYKIIQYHNDNTFNIKNLSRFIKFYRYRSRINLCDYIFYYRYNDLRHLKKYYVNNNIFPPYYNEKVHYNQRLQKKIDVVFIGHYENDNREIYLNYLYDKKINLLVGGPSKQWLKSRISSNLKNEIRPYYDSEYRKKINESKIGICFLSKINNDNYTRRCFEFPACGTPIIMPKTKILENIFGNYYQYYNSKEELYKILSYYLKNEKERLQLLQIQEKIVKKFEIKEICKKLSKDLKDISNKNNLKILFHHPSLTSYRLFFFNKIQDYYSRVDFLFNYSNLIESNNLNNSVFLSKKIWQGRTGKFIFNLTTLKKPIHDVLITNDHLNIPAIINVFLHLIYKKKIVIWSAVNKENFKNKILLKKLYLKFLYYFSDLILCINSQNKEFIDSYKVSTKTILLPNATINFSKQMNKIDSNKEVSFIKKQLKINNNFKNILYVGRIEELKGITNLLKALELIKNEKFNLILVGKNYLDCNIFKKYKCNIFIFDEVHFNKLNDFYLISDIFVLPSLDETWGMVLKEAFSYNLVTLCSKMAGCYPDLVNEENSLCFDPNNIDELHFKLEQALQSKDSLIFRKLKDIKLTQFSIERQIEIFNYAIKKLFS